MEVVLDTGELVIHDDVPDEIVFDGKFGRGLVERDFAKYPEKMYAPPSEIELIPESEVPDWIASAEKNRSRISDIRDQQGYEIPCLNQGSVGYCWSHSVVHTVMLQRKIMNQPYVPLSAYMVAAIIKGGRDEGGWCGLSMEFIRDVGCSDQEHWEQGDRRLSNDTPACRENAKKYRITKGWFDEGKAAWDQKYSFRHMVTLNCQNVAQALDFNWWSHSVCGMDAVNGVSMRNITRSNGKRLQLVDFDKVWGMNNPITMGIGERILNSWGMAWGQRGASVLTGNKAIPNGAIGTTSVTPSA